MSYSDPHIKAVRGGVNMPGMGGQHGPESLPCLACEQIERYLILIFCFIGINISFFIYDMHLQ